MAKHRRNSSDYPLPPHRSTPPKHRADPPPRITLAALLTGRRPIEHD